jgi:two-component sensor histidine kinase
VTHFVLKINNDFDDLRAAADSATQFLKSNNASSEVIFAANLAIEEIVTNIIKYGFDDARSMRSLSASKWRRIRSTSKSATTEKNSILSIGSIQTSRFRPKSPESAVLAYTSSTKCSTPAHITGVTDETR